MHIMIFEIVLNNFIESFIPLIYISVLLSVDLIIGQEQCYKFKSISKVNNLKVLVKKNLQQICIYFSIISMYQNTVKQEYLEV